MKGADRKLGLVPGELLALGEGARAFCCFLLQTQSFLDVFDNRTPTCSRLTVFQGTRLGGGAGMRVEAKGEMAAGAERQFRLPGSIFFF